MRMIDYDSKMPTTGKILWEYTIKPIMQGFMAGTIFTALIVCFLNLIR